MPSLFIDIEARFAKFQDALDQMQRKSGKTASAIQSAFAGVGRSLSSLTGLAGLTSLISGGGLIALTKQVADQGDALSKLSQRTGVAVEELSKLQYAASLNDVSNDQLSDGLKVLAKNMADTAAGTGRARGAFEALGLTQDIQAGKFRTAGELFTEVAERMSKYADGANKSAIAQKIFGDSGAQMIPLLNAGAAGLREMGDEAERFGAVMSGDLAAQSAEFNDNLTRIQTRIDGLKISIGNELLPVLLNISEAFAKSEGAATAFSGAISAVRTVLETVVVLGANVGYVFKQAGTEIGGIAAQLAALATGDFNAFSTIGKMMREDAEKARRDIDEFSDRILNPEKYRKRDAGSGTTTGKPNAPGLAVAGEVDRAAAAELAAALKDLERMIAAEQQLLTVRNQMIDRHNSANLISFRQHYEARAAAQQEALDKTRAAYDEELALLQKRLSTAPAKERAGIEEKIADVINKRAQAETAAAAAGVDAWLDQQRAAEQYENQLIDITARLADLRGESAKAVVLRFEVQNADVRKRLEVEATDPAGDEASRERARAALEELDAIRQLTEAQARVNELRDQAAVIQERLATTEQSLNTDREAGIITELEMMGQLGEARRASAEQLEKIAEEMRAIAILADDQRLIANAEAFKAQIDQLAASADVLARKIDSVFKDAFTDSFADVITGTKTLSEAFNNMANDILRSFARILAQNIAERLFGGIGSGIGSLFKSANGSAYHGGNILPFAKGGAFTNQVVTSPTLFRFARGGQEMLGEMGEAGPEAIMPLKADGSGRLGVLVAGGGVLPLRRDGAGRLAVALDGAGLGGSAMRSAKFAAGGVFDRTARAVSAAASGEVTRVQDGPSATTGGRTAQPAVFRPQITPEMADMTMRDWVEGWLAREMAGR